MKLFLNWIYSKLHKVYGFCSFPEVIFDVFMIIQIVSKLIFESNLFESMQFQAECKTKFEMHIDM